MVWAKAYDPLPPFALLGLAEKFSLVKRWATAAIIARTASRIRPNDYEIHRTLGWYLRNAGKPFYDEAEREFRYALNLNPGDHEALGMLGGLLKRQERYSEAAALYARGVKEAPDNLYLRVAHAGLTLLADPRSDSSAMQLYQDLVTLCLDPEKPRDPWALVMAAEANFVLGNDETAYALFKEAHGLAESPTILVSPADQLDLFAQAGFRPESASSLASRLRSLAETIGAKAIRRGAVSGRSSSQKLLPVIVHLSDLHFGYKLGTDGKRIDMHRFRDGDYSVTLKQHMINEFNQTSGRFRLDPVRIILAISGDVVYQAGQDEYQAALTSCNMLVEELSIPRERVIFCPGNHDISWADAKTDRTRRFDNYLSS